LPAGPDDVQRFLKDFFLSLCDWKREEKVEVRKKHVKVSVRVLFLDVVSWSVLSVSLFLSYSRQELNAHFVSR